MDLTKSQIDKLKKDGEKIKATVIIGKNGLTDAVVKMIDNELLSHELVKIKVLDTDIVSLKDAAPIIKEKTKSEIIRIIGKTLVIYRENPEKSS